MISSCQFNLVAILGGCLAVASVQAENVLTNEWTINVRGHSDTTAAVGTNGTIYFGTQLGKLWAVNPDGSSRWVFSARNEIRSSPALAADDTVYFGSRDRRLYAVRSDGTERWSFLTGGWVDSSPALAHDGTVYFGSWDRVFYALNADGSKRWQFPTGGEIVSSPAIGADGTVYFGSHDGKFYALSAGGQKQWEFGTGGPILSSPALNGAECVYFTSVDGFLYALKLDGTLLWRLRTGSITESSPVIAADGTIYLGARQHLWSISPGGQKNWGRTDAEYTPFDTTPVVLSDGTICCVWSYGALLFYSPAGASRSMYYLFGYGYGGPAIGPNGCVYVSDRGLAEAGYSALRANVSLARTPWPKFHGNPRNTGNILDSP